MSMSATLGGLIKDYRLQKNLSQIEIAFALGWSEPSRLSRIEQGKVENPSRELIDRICAVLKLEKEEKNQLLLTGSYLPSEEEIAEVREKVNPFLYQWLYPAALFDFSWRIISINEAGKQALLVEQGKKVRENILEVLFDPDFGQNKYLKGSDKEEWYKYLVRLMAQFQYRQRSRTKQSWYIRLIRRMMSNEWFRDIWQKALLSGEMDVIGNFGRKAVVTGTKQTPINYYFFVLPVLEDPRFEIELFLPTE